jgi:cytochrome c2
MKNFLSIAFFTLVISMLYTGVAQLLPQLRDDPPPKVELGADVGPEKLAEAGQKIFASVCNQCHKMGEAGRAPDLADIGRGAQARADLRAAATGKPYTPAEYLIESMCKPADYIVEPFSAMPALTIRGGDFLAAAAYLQTLGAEATLRGTEKDSLVKFGCNLGGAGAASGAPVAAGPKQPVGPPETLFMKFCGACHAIEDPEVKSGPSLFNVGKRLSKGEIYESILAPDAATATGFAKGLMQGTLDTGKFYDQMTPADYQALVDWLAGKKG